MADALRTDITSDTPRALHPGQHNEANQKLLDIETSAGQPGGFATIDIVTGRVPASQLPQATALDQDLVDLGNLTPADDDFVQRKGGTWTNRTVAQVKADLGVTAGGGGGFVSSYKWGVGD